MYNLTMDSLKELMNALGDADVSEEYKNPKFHDVLKKFFRERKYTVKDTGISYRIINNWKDNKIIPESCFSQKNQDWAKFNLIELIWIKIANDLRLFGLPLDKIRKVKEDLLLWDPIQQTYLDLEYKIYISITTDLDLFALIEQNGRAYIKSADFLISVKDILSTIKFSFPRLIIISIKDLIKDLVGRVEPPKPILKVSNEEIELLERIRLNEAKTITVEKKNGKIFEIQTSEIISGKPNILEKIKELEKDETYGDTTLHLQKGIIESMEIKKKKRL